MNAIGSTTSLAKTAPADLAAYLQQMRDQERSDLARELHDELGSLLTGAKLEVASLKLRLDGTSSDVIERLTSLTATINSLIAFSRRIVDGLHPSSLTNLGLRASLEILVNDFRRTTGIAVTADLDQVDLDYETQLTAYRMVQEALNNASKHAQATEIQVVMKNRGADVLLSVGDNGTGFETAALGLSGHGLAGMHHRIAAGGGRLTIRSASGLGTLLTATLRNREGVNRRATPLMEARSRVAAEPHARPARAREVTRFALIDDKSVDYLTRVLSTRDAAATQPVSNAADFVIPLQPLGTGAIDPAGNPGLTGRPMAARAGYVAGDARRRPGLRRKPEPSRDRYPASCRSQQSKAKL